MSADDRFSTALNFWLDETDEEFQDLPQNLQATLQRADGPPDDVSSADFDPLMKAAARYSTMGWRNEYLAERHAALGLGQVEVLGHVETLHECPLCKFLTLRERNNFDVCPVCFWEDATPRYPDELSGPNHMSLNQAQAAFADYGCAGEEYLACLPDDRFRRYVQS